MPLGPWHVAFFGQGAVPSPTVKKNCLSTVCGTLTGNLAVARDRNFLEKLATKLVSLMAGRLGIKVVIEVGSGEWPGP